MEAMPTNVARRLSIMAAAQPEAVAVVEPLGRGSDGRRRYRHVTFRELDDDSERLARGILAAGAKQGTRLALLVRPGVDFISLTFALFKSGTVAVLIDPGMGRRSMINCLAEVEPEGFVAIPAAQAVRSLLPHRFPKAKINVTVGRRWWWRGTTLHKLRSRSWDEITLPNMSHDDPAAIIFTTGSTGAPKGVLFSHGNFDAQVDQIRDFYGIAPGEIDMPCFPLFGLFNCAMGSTAVIPDMDPSRPAQVDPRNIIEAAADWKVTQSFGSPAIWDRVSRYCETTGERMPTIRRVMSAGAPIPADVLRRTMACIHPDGEVHTPYGATESLPVASNSATEVLGLARNDGGTAAKTRQGAGVCVGRRFAGIRWKIIRIVDGPIRSIDEIEELPRGEIGEIIVNGPQVTRAYVTRLEANALSKIADASSVWHRIGDSGYLDAEDRFWFCGRVTHRVLTPGGPMYPMRCEAIFNCHPAVRRSALVGVGPAGRQRPIIILELHQDSRSNNREEQESLLNEIRELGAANPLTVGISDFLIHPSFPVDIRHNAKIFREKLAVWAETMIACSR